MKKNKGLIVITIASLIMLTLVSYGTYWSVKQNMILMQMFLDKDKVVRSYENHHGAQLGVYYKIQGYSGDGELPERPTSFFIVTKVEFDSYGILSENLELREIEVPKVPRKEDGKTPDLSDLLNKYVVFEVVDNVQRRIYLKDDEELIGYHQLGIGIK